MTSSQPSSQVVPPLGHQPTLLLCAHNHGD